MSGNLDKNLLQDAQGRDNFPFGGITLDAIRQYLERELQITLMRAAEIRKILNHKVKCQACGK